MITTPAADPVCYLVEYTTVAPDTVVYNWNVQIVKIAYRLVNGQKTAYWARQTIRRGQFTTRPEDVRKVRVCTNGPKQLQANVTILSRVGSVLIKFRPWH